ncbi:hypothetical protein ACFX11_030388 [Malus domestica]
MCGPRYLGERDSAFLASVKAFLVWAWDWTLWGVDLAQVRSYDPWVKWWVDWRLARLLVQSLVRAFLESLCMAKNIARVRIRNPTCSTISGVIRLNGCDCNNDRLIVIQLDLGR